jgi:LysR family transcriptional regulator, glycine cleavage system transcriptional activator
VKPTRNDPRLLRGLHYFEAVARLGSVGDAAKEIGVSSSAVSHQLRELAEIVGEKLIERAGRGIALTAAGSTLSRKLQSTFSELDRMVAEVVGETHLAFSLAVCSCFGPNWLVPRLSGFIARHPEIDIEVRLYHQDPELTHSAADAIITAEPVKPGYDSIVLFEEMMVAVRAPASQAMATSRANRLITTDLHAEILGRDWQDFCAQTGRELGDLKTGEWLRCSHYVLALEMAKAGLGLALIPDFLAARHVGKGELAYFDNSRVSARRSYRLCYKTKRASDEAIRAFGRWIKSELPEFLAASGNFAAIRG